ncbi:GIY-YIG nuclease family protein [Paractinoplanes maris]|uniref:GIY-YIG nuclease family protein n=1 Tax=Paractinoplanes maris TaxID=1734446 RepID=UPI0020200F04|nr:GIY-YIG nuclease family protein [Actinoplanes maris]
MPTATYTLSDTPDPTGTNTPAVSWMDGAWAQIYNKGSWADIPKQPANEQAERRNRSAWMTYGIRPSNIVMPHADPLDIRLRLNSFDNKVAYRRANVRLLVRDIAAADPRRAGIRASRARERISENAKARPADLAEAHQVVAHFDALHYQLGKRIAAHRLTTNGPAVLAIGYMISLYAMALAPEGPHFRLWQVALAALVGMACTFQIGRERGWIYGYNQAVWHCAEVRVDQSDAVAEAQRAEADLAQAKRAEQAEHERHLATRRVAFKLARQPRNEGYLYVLEFSTGSIKVGLTEDPKRRLGQHLGEARAFGVYITNYWISPSCHNFVSNETRLINACGRVSKQRSRKEYFHDVPYATAVGFANELTYFSKNTEQASVEGVWA